MYAINITEKNGKFEGEVYKFSIFTPTQLIADGTLGLEDAVCYNDEYALIYPIQVGDSKLSVLSRTAELIHENIHLSFWGCAFENGKYSKELTIALQGKYVALILPDDCY